LIYKEHAAFHDKMVAQITNLLSDTEIDTLVATLEKLDNFFSELAE